MREEDKHRAPAYVPDGPVHITPPTAVEKHLALAICRIEILEAQVKSLQMAAPRGIPKASVEEIEKAK